MAPRNRINERERRDGITKRQRRSIKRRLTRQLFWHVSQVRHLRAELAVLDVQHGFALEELYHPGQSTAPVLPPGAPIKSFLKPSTMTQEEFDKLMEETFPPAGDQLPDSPESPPPEKQPNLLERENVREAFCRLPGVRRRIREPSVSSEDHDYITLHDEGIEL